MQILLQDIAYMRPTKRFGVGLQITLVSILFLTQAAMAYYQWPHGSIWPTLYRPYPYLILAPIYEELLMRGLLLSALTRFYSVRNAVIISSLLFGLWHAKNVLYLPLDTVLIQVLYAGLIVGPICAYLTIRTRNIWWGAMVHYLNNIFAPFSPIIWAWVIHKLW